MNSKPILKKCSRCKSEYPATLEHFNKCQSRKDGLQPYCKECRRKDYQAHKTERLQHQKQYRKTIPGYLRNIWRNMLNRCINQKFKQYKDYGGRGIKVKFESLDDFRDYVMNLLKIDPRGLTIDRIDNDGNYERGNIRFVSQAENNRNRRSYKKSHRNPKGTQRACASYSGNRARIKK